MVIFHSYISLPEGKPISDGISQRPIMFDRQFLGLGRHALFKQKFQIQRFNRQQLFRTFVG